MKVSLSLALLASDRLLEEFVQSTKNISVMSDPFDSDPIGSMTSNNQLLPPVSGQEQEDILSQQVISTGGQENPYSGSLPLTSAEDQFILGQSVATLEAQSVSANNSDADVLTGETREASQFFSNIVGGTLDFFSGDPYQAGGPGPLLVNDTANKLYEWQAGVHKWIPSLGPPSPVNINQALDSDSKFSAVGEVNLGSNIREIFTDGRKGLNTGNWGWGPVNGDYRLPPDYFVVKGYTETYLEGGQTYRFEAKGDDGYQIWLKNLGTDEWYWVTPENQWQSTVGEQGTDVFNYTIPGDKGGQYYVGFFHYEVDQEAYFGLNWTEADYQVQDNITFGAIDGLGNKSRLTVDEIREQRRLIGELPQAEQAGWYRKLQYQVPYFNQMDNEHFSVANEMCNVTTLASCLTFLGVENPEPHRQFEDVLDDIILNNPSLYPDGRGINDSHSPREYWAHFSTVADNLGVASSGTQYLPGFNPTDLDYFKNFVASNWEPALNEGKAVMSGVRTTKAHIVKVIDIDWNRGGIVVDDPFGQAQDSPLNDYKQFGYNGSVNTTNRGPVNTQQGQDEEGIGNDNFWSWSYCAEVFGDIRYLILG